jgi:hypothetical protein
VCAAEYSRALRSASPPRLVQRSASAIAGWCPQDHITAADDSDFFEYDDSAVGLMWNFPIFGEGDELIDIVAWRRKRPERWWLYSGAALFTSAWLFRRAVEWGDPIHLVATPEEWVADPCHSAVILQPALVDLYSLLASLPRIDCTDDLRAFLRVQMIRQVQANINFGSPECRRSTNGS